MKKIVLIVLGVVVVGVAALAFLLIKTGRELKPLAEGVLRDVWAGRVEKVYGEASAPFRESTSLADFERLAASCRDVYGGFRRVVKTTGAGTSTSTGKGTLGKVSLELEFEKGTTHGEFQFVKEDGAWKLLRFDIDPLKGAPPPPPDRSKLLAAAQECLDSFRKGELVALYQRFSPELQKAWPPEKFQSDMKAFREKVGSMEAAVHQKTEDAPEGLVLTTYQIPCAAGEVQAQLKWAWRNGAWDLLGFHVGT